MSLAKLAFMPATLILLTACGPVLAEGKTDQGDGVYDTSVKPIISIGAVTGVEIEPGLAMRVLQEGTGAVATTGSKVSVNYTGWLYDESAENKRGTQIDSSVDRGQVFEFELGAGTIIQGWEKGILGMKIGEVRELTIASPLAFGESGWGQQIPPGSTVILEISLENATSPVSPSTGSVHVPVVADTPGKIQPAELDPTTELEKVGDGALKTEPGRWIVHQWAEDGHLGAQKILAKAYWYGSDLPKDLPKAIHWYERAALQGDVGAQSKLAHELMGYADKSIRNVPKALKWLRMSTKPGEIQGFYALWNIRSAIEPKVRYLFDADDLVWLDFQLSGGEQEAAKENRQACRSDVWRRIARCYSYSTIVGCSNCKYEFTCQTSRGRGKCDPSNKYINYEFDYYCDPEIGKEFDTREEVLQDSCR